MFTVYKPNFRSNVLYSKNILKAISSKTLKEGTEFDLQTGSTTAEGPESKPQDFGAISSARRAQAAIRLT